MYVPPHFEWRDKEEALAFVQRYNFALLVNAHQGHPLATHLPFVVESHVDEWTLLSHMASANPQSRLLTSGECLVVFSEPHAYISPTLYARSQNVPTWNYLSVHCYGTARILGTRESKTALLEKMIAYYESSYRDQWNTLNDKYRNTLLDELTAFEIDVTRLEASAKLSQNKSASEQERIAKWLENSPDAAARSLAGYMNRQPDSKTDH